MVKYSTERKKDKEVIIKTRFQGQWAMDEWVLLNLPSLVIASRVNSYSLSKFGTFKSQFPNNAALRNWEFVTKTFRNLPHSLSFLLVFLCFLLSFFFQFSPKLCLRSPSPNFNQNTQYISFLKYISLSAKTRKRNHGFQIPFPP